MGGRNTVLLDAISWRIPLVSDIPTIIFGADVTHPETGEDSSPSIAAVRLVVSVPLDQYFHQNIHILFLVSKILGVQVDYNVVHLRTSLVQLFVVLQNFEKLVQMIELKRFGGAPNGYPFAPLKNTSPHLFS
jgi:hypothetical protein